MIGRVSGIVIDCPDPKALAVFYGEVTGLPMSYESDDWVTLSEPDGPMRLDFQSAPELKTPRWPDPEYPQQFHLDIEVDDVAVAEPKVLALGASKLPGGGETFRVYADPAGHPFCLVW